MAASFTAGTRLGTYEVLGRLGAGGMGEVYRARDTKLGREVAIKVLPEAFALDPDRLARFEREAKLLASLNHPHIAAIYGIEEAPSAGSGQAAYTRFLVLELVEGETLEGHITGLAGSKGPAVPVAQTIAIARQIADALQAAHDKGIIHRDLKPANIALTSDGQVKVLDFGLAKFDGSDESVQPGASGGLAGLTQSPTMMSPVMTGVGMILGTAAYMSPEQAKGRPADKRSDIWAFGCVLYEMLTGVRPFKGDDVSDMLATILKSEPDWHALPSDVPPAVRTLVERCLEKDRSKRIADISVARFILDEPALFERAATVGPAPLAPVPPVWRRVGALAAALIAGGLLAGTTVWFVTRPPAPRITRLAIATTGASAMVRSGNDRDLAISPDGSRVAYVGADNTIVVRALDQLDATSLKGVGAARGLFFSPDNQWLGFFDGSGSLKKVPVSGGQAITLCRIGANPRGGTWNEDDTIVFATNEAATGLWRVPAGGGEATVLTKPNMATGEGDHVWPVFLPGGTAVLFTIVPATGPIDTSRVAVLDLATGTQKIVVQGGSDAHYAQSGHLVYAAAGALRAVVFDIGRLEPQGAATVVLPRLAITGFGAGEFDIALDGTLVYIPGVQAAPRDIVWVDRQGREELTRIPPRPYQYARLSPDGTRVALDARDQESDIWVWDLGRETLRRLTFDPAPDRFPVWTPDGRRVLFGSDRTGLANLFAHAADGSGQVERLTESPNQQFPMSVTPDGRYALIREAAPNQNLMRLALDGTSRGTEPLLQTPFAEQNAEVSPDGRWLAYESDSSGQFEVYVRPFAAVSNGPWQVSSGGGLQPLWSRDGRELFYLTTGALMSVPVEPGPVWNTNRPAKLFDERYFHGGGPGAGTGRTYDVSLDGQRFLMMKLGGASDRDAPLPSLLVVQNWFEELKRLAPRK